VTQSVFYVSFSRHHNVFIARVAHLEVYSSRLCHELLFSEIFLDNTQNAWETCFMLEGARGIYVMRHLCRLHVCDIYVDIYLFCDIYVGTRHFIIFFVYLNAAVLHICRTQPRSPANYTYHMTKMSSKHICIHFALIDLIDNGTILTLQEVAPFIIYINNNTLMS